MLIQFTRPDGEPVHVEGSAVIAVAKNLDPDPKRRTCISLISGREQIVQESVGDVLRKLEGR